MSNYTKYGKGVIFCAPAQMLDQPLRKESPVDGDYLPGTVVHYDAAAKRFTAGPGDMSYVLDKDHLGQEPVDASYQVGDRATAFYPQPAIILNVLVEPGQAVTEDAKLFATDTGTLTLDGPTIDDGEGGTMPDPDARAYCYGAESLTTGSSAQLVAVKFI